jgi:hypothetical protein
MNIKAISPVVAIALILVVAVVAVVGFQSWNNDFQSGVFTNVESKTTTGASMEINQLIDGVLYVKSTSDENIRVSSIKVGDTICNFTATNLTKGINEIVLGDCLNNTGVKEDVVLVTEEYIDSKTFYLGDESDTSSGIQAPPSAVSITFNANETTTGYYDNITLSWSVSDAEECWASGNWTGSKNNAFGLESIQIKGISTFNLTCNVLANCLLELSKILNLR